MIADYKRRVSEAATTATSWSTPGPKPPLVETRRIVAQFETPEALRDAMTRFIAENSVQAYVLYRELDFSSSSARSRSTAAAILSSSGPCSAIA